MGSGYINPGLVSVSVVLVLGVLTLDYREIRGGRLRANVRGPISASMMKGPEALGARGCLGRSCVR